MRQHYLPLACCQMALVRGTTDVIGQCVQRADDAPLAALMSLDASHTLAMMTVGLLSGGGGAIWLRHLESQLGSCTRPSSVAKKAALDFLCWGPTSITASLVLVPLLTGATLDASLASATEGLPLLMLYELFIFGPYNLIGFTLVPPEARPTVKGFCSFVFALVLSFHV